MKRDPSIHITLSSLARVLQDMRIPNYKQMAEDILVASKPYALKSRHQVLAKSRQSKKADRHAQAGEVNVELFNKILAGKRLEAQHKGLTKITKAHRDYVELREVAAIAEKFAEDFEYSKLADAFSDFIEIGMSVMKTGYTLRKFKSNKNRIFQTMNDLLEIRDDENPELSDSLAKAFRDEVYQLSGIPYNLTPEDAGYVHIVRGAALMAELNADPYDWVKAISSRMGHVDLTMLYGDLTRNMYIRYMSTVDRVENKIDQLAPVSDAQAKFLEIIKGNV